MAPPVFLSVRTLGELLRSRQVSPVELTTIFLDRLEARGPTYNAVVTLPRDLALGQARAAETELRAGRSRGPLHGIPYGAKDVLATGGGMGYRQPAASFTGPGINSWDPTRCFGGLSCLSGSCGIR